MNIKKTIYHHILKDVVCCRHLFFGCSGMRAHPKGCGFKQTSIPDIKKIKWIQRKSLGFSESSFSTKSRNLWFLAANKKHLSNIKKIDKCFLFVKMPHALRYGVSSI